MKAFICLVIVILLAFVGVVGAALTPETTEATNVGNNNFTLNCNGGFGQIYFKYGTDPSHLNIWTQQVTPSGGSPYSASTTETGSPIMPSTTYYFTACSVTYGCAWNTLSFTTLALVPIPTSTLGNAITNMTKSRFNLLYLPANIAIPYGWLFPSDASSQSTALMIVFGMMFFFIYVGLWLRTRSVATGVIIGLLTSSFILFADQGLMLGIPPEFSAIAQGLLYASLAGILLAWLKK
jgi:hypothetical protein